VIGGVVINVYIIVVQEKTVRPRTTIIGVEDNEVDYLFRHFAFGIGVSRGYLAQAPSIRGSFEEFVLSNHLLSCGVKRYKHVVIWEGGRWLETRWK